MLSCIDHGSDEANSTQKHRRSTNLLAKGSKLLVFSCRKSSAPTTCHPERSVRVEGVALFNSETRSAFRSYVTSQQQVGNIDEDEKRTVIASLF